MGTYHNYKNSFFIREQTYYSSGNYETKMVEPADINKIISPIYLREETLSDPLVFHDV
jgi:hypothetical protein